MLATILAVVAYSFLVEQDGDHSLPQLDDRANPKSELEPRNPSRNSFSVHAGENQENHPDVLSAGPADLGDQRYVIGYLTDLAQNEIPMDIVPSSTAKDFVIHGRSLRDTLAIANESPELTGSLAIPLFSINRTDVAVQFASIYALRPANELVRAEARIDYVVCGFSGVCLGSSTQSLIDFHLSSLTGCVLEVSRELLPDSKYLKIVLGQNAPSKRLSQQFSPSAVCDLWLDFREKRTCRILVLGDALVVSRMIQWRDHQNRLRFAELDGPELGFGGAIHIDRDIRVVPEVSMSMPSIALRTEIDGLDLRGVSVVLRAEGGIKLAEWIHESDVDGFWRSNESEIFANHGNLYVDVSGTCIKRQSIKIDESTDTLSINVESDGTKSLEVLLQAGGIPLAAVGVTLRLVRTGPYAPLEVHGKCDVHGRWITPCVFSEESIVELADSAAIFVEVHEGDLCKWIADDRGMKVEQVNSVRTVFDTATIRPSSTIEQALALVVEVRGRAIVDGGIIVFGASD